MPLDTVRVLKIIRIKHVVEKIGLSRSSIYDRLNPDSPRYDASFPRPISIGISAVGWLEVDIDEWIKSRVAQSIK
ncbi:AlpA family phage regulatory protein [Pseudomonas aeruginosa]|nr:AlpA family phage regulatory protein [Pseudomonas aeruginosa]MCS9649605.1 AlpA family phage regulatory protein [Pseudomonas aeruginosa]